MPSLEEESDGRPVNAACPTVCLTAPSPVLLRMDPAWPFHSKALAHVTDVLFAPLSVPPCFSSDFSVEKEGKKNKKTKTEAGVTLYRWELE